METKLKKKLTPALTAATNPAISCLLIHALFKLLPMCTRNSITGHSAFILYREHIPCLSLNVHNGCGLKCVLKRRIWLFDTTTPCSSLPPIQIWS